MMSHINLNINLPSIVYFSGRVPTCTLVSLFSALLTMPVINIHAEFALSVLDMSDYEFGDEGLAQIFTYFGMLCVCAVHCDEARSDLGGERRSETGSDEWVDVDLSEPEDEPTKLPEALQM